MISVEEDVIISFSKPECGLETESMPDLIFYVPGGYLASIGSPLAFIMIDKGMV